MKKRREFLATGVALATCGMLFVALGWGAARFSGETGARAHRTRLAAGILHACTILDDGTVQCWGDNSYGQLGDGSSGMGSKISPVRVSNLSGAISIAAGDNFTCAIVGASGAVRCWGDNGFGQLGITTSIPASATPVTVAGLSNMVALSAGAGHTCAVRVDGTVWCWGESENGQIGPAPIPFNSGHSSQPLLVPLPNPAISVSAGLNHTCALLVDGTVQCWGTNTFGQLGNGTSDGGFAHPNPTPTAPLSTVSGVGAVDVTASSSFTCARLSDASVSCWGSNEFGKLGIGSTVDSLVPVRSSLGATAAIASSVTSACAILVNGTVSCMGQLDFSGGTLPGQPVPSVANAMEIAVGSNFACALLSGGSVRCWGKNNAGQHGDGTTAPADVDSVSGINGTFLGRGVAAANQFTCGRRGTGGAACWGSDGLNQLGSSASGGISTIPLAVPALTAVLGLAAGGAHACALDPTGGAQCWGYNSRGQIGNGTLGGSSPPVPVATGGFPLVSIAAGDQHTCGLTVFGFVVCWGAGDRGQLGTGGASDSAVPAFVAGIQNAIAITAGNQFTCALLVDGTVDCWGDNSAGQLGDGGTEVVAYVPQAVPGLKSVVAIAGGATHVCALTASGTLNCWGANSRGQIGNGSTVTALFPTTVAGLTDAVSIAAGAAFTCAARAGGGASCWGANDTGELAARDSVDHLTPTPVIHSIVATGCTPLGCTYTYFPETAVAGIVTSRGTRFIGFPTPHTVLSEHACALLTSGVIDCWGANLAGEVGNGTTTNQPRPTVVNSFAANVDGAAQLRNGRIAEVTALINCETGAQAHLILTLQQGGASGMGQAEAACEGRLIRVPLNVPAQGPNGFSAGAATANVEAIVMEQGTLLEDTHWTKQVTLSPAQ